MRGAWDGKGCGEVDHMNFVETRYLASIVSMRGPTLAILKGLPKKDKRSIASLQVDFAKTRSIASLQSYAKTRNRLSIILSPSDSFYFPSHPKACCHLLGFRHGNQKV